MHDGFFLNRTVDVISTKLQPKFRKVITDVHAVRFDVGDVVQHEPRDRDGSQNF